MSSSAQRIGESFGRASASYDAAAVLQLQVLRDCMERARALLPQGAVLDLGCGTGRLNRMVQEAALDWRMTALDLSHGMCRTAKESASLVINADAEALPFADHRFDLVLSSLMLQWVQQPRTVFAEVARVLKPGGFAVFSTLGPATLQELKETFATLDASPRVNEFMALLPLKQSVCTTGLKIDDAQSETLQLTYPDMQALLQSLKSIGATPLQHEDRKRGLTTASTIGRASQHYAAQYANAAGVVATWEILTLVLRKP